MSAPTPAPGDDRPREGYYPDPSIPGYVRYWNGVSWVPGTSRPAPRDGEPLVPPSGAGAAAPVVEETGPHFFDEDPRSSGWGTGPGTASHPVPSDGTAPHLTGHGEGAVPVPSEAGTTPDSGGTFIFRRPTPGPAAVQDPSTMTFRPVPAHEGPRDPGGQVPPARSGPGASGGFSAGKAAAARAASAQPPPAAQSPRSPLAPRQPLLPEPAAHVPPHARPSAPAAMAAPVPPQAVPPHPPQAGPPYAATPVTSGPGGGQASWAQQVHRLAGSADAQPVVPWKPPVEDVFQAAARRQAAARPAGLGRRLIARLLDNLVIGAVTAAAAVPLGTRAADHLQHKIDEARLSGRTVTVWLLDGTTGTALAVVLAVLLVFGVLYEVLPTARWGRTLGKKLCGVEVRDIEAHEPPAFGAALRRWLVYSVPGLLGIGLVGILWCLFDRPWRQCWHDKAAHTFVAA